jgi:hypothetical protein
VDDRARRGRGSPIGAAARPVFQPFPSCIANSATFSFRYAARRRAAQLELTPGLRHSSNRVASKKPLQWENRTMDALKGLKHLIAALTEIGLMLLALAIVAALLVGGNVPFFGSVVTNITAVVKELGSNGLVGLIALGLILWLFSKRSIA